MQQSAMSLFGSPQSSQAQASQAQGDPNADDSQSQQPQQGSFIQAAAQTMRSIQDLASMNPDFAPFADKILQLFQQGLVQSAQGQSQQGSQAQQQPMSNNAAMSSPQYA